MATFVWQPFPVLRTAHPSYNTNTVNPNVGFSATESAEGYTIKAVIPGINPNDLQIELANQKLTIKSETFSRSFSFGLPLNADAVETSYSYGVLTITLPKADSLKPRRIAVQVAQPVAEQPVEETPAEQPAA